MKSARTPSPRRRCFTLSRMLVGIMLSPAVWGQTAANPAALSEAQPSSPARQSLYDAWWTGPMLANSAATLPRGHYLIEPYVYDVSSPHSDGFGSLTYMLYGCSMDSPIG
jgi:hypothetical protein